MQTSTIDLIVKSELNLDNKHNQDQDINQLTCCLKDAIFSKYISNYLIEKVEKMWILYEQRIDKFLKEKHLDITCHHTRPQTVIQLEELAKNQEENISAYKRDIDILCSSRKRIRNDEKYSIQLQSTTSTSSIRVPKTPRCIDRYENNIDDLKENKITNEYSLTTIRNNFFHHCIFQHGEILSIDPNTKTRTIRITYLCND